MTMNTNKLSLRRFLLLLVIVKLCGALTVPPSPINTPTKTRIAKNNNPIAVGLFRSYHGHYEGNDDEGQQPMKPTQLVNIISRKLKIMRSFVFVRFSSLLHNNKKRYLSVIAAAIIAAGAFPSHVTAVEATTATVIPASITIAVATNTRMIESEMDTSIAEKYFIQDTTVADVSDYNYNIGDNEDDFFDTTLLADIDASGTNDVVESIEDGIEDGNDYEYETTADDCSTALPVVEDVSQILTTTKNNDPEVLVINDRMVKNGLTKMAVASTGAAGLYLVSKKAQTAGLNSDNDDSEINNNDDKIIVPSEKMKADDHVVADSEVGDDASLHPLSSRKDAEARKQPKSSNAEAVLAARYEAIPNLEERAYQILVDLGMIEVA